LLPERKGSPETGVGRGELTKRPTAHRSDRGSKTKRKRCAKRGGPTNKKGKDYFAASRRRRRSHVPKSTSKTRLEKLQDEIKKKA